MQNIEKMNRKKKVSTKFHDLEARMRKLHKPQRGGGVKGAFRDSMTNLDKSSIYLW